MTKTHTNTKHAKKLRKIIITKYFKKKQMSTSAKVVLTTCNMVTIITVVNTPIKLSSTHSSAARMQPLSYMFLSPVWVGKFKLVHFSAYYKYYMTV